MSKASKATLLIRAQRRLVGLVSLAPALLLILKIIEVALEDGRGGFGSTLGSGVLRRLDDADFWFVLFIAVGSSRIFTASFRVSDLPLTRRAGRTERMIVHTLAVVFGLAFVAMLLAEAFSNQAMFWWARRLPGNQLGIRLIQRTEGALVIACLFAWTLFLVTCIRVGEDLRWVVEQERLRDRMPRRRLREAELLVNGCLAPFQLLFAGAFVILALLAAIAVAELHEGLYAWVKANMGPVEPLAIIGLFALAIIPSLIVAGWLHWRWFSFIRWSLGRGFLQRPLWIQCRIESQQFGQ